MSAVPFVVPTLSPSGAVHFAAVKQDPVAQDIIDALSENEEVITDILGDLAPSGWAIQRVPKEASTGTWNEEDLRNYGNGN